MWGTRVSTACEALMNTTPDHSAEIATPDSNKFVMGERADAELAKPCDALNRIAGTAKPPDRTTMYWTRPLPRVQ